MNKTLFDISDEMMKLDAVLNDLEEDDEEGQQAILEGYASTLENDLERKLDGYCTYIGELEARSQARKEEAERLMHRSRVDSNRVASLKNVLKWFFQMHDLKNYETTRYRLTLAQNGGKLPVLFTVGIDELPEGFVEQIITLKPLTDEIRNALESGAEVQGCLLGERGSSIRIK